MLSLLTNSLVNAVEEDDLEALKTVLNNLEDPNEINIKFIRSEYRSIPISMVRSWQQLLCLISPLISVYGPG